MNIKWLSLEEARERWPEPRKVVVEDGDCKERPAPKKDTRERVGFFRGARITKRPSPENA